MEIISTTKNRLIFIGNNSEGRDLDGVLYTGKKDKWWVPMSAQKAQEIKEYLDDNGISNDEFNEVYDEYMYQDFDYRYKVAGVYDERLRDYQNFHVDRIKKLKNYGLFFEMRLGKTPTSIVATREENKIIVSVPNGLQVAWKREWLTWGDREAIIVKGSPAKREKIYKDFANSKEMILIGTRDTLARDTLAGLLNFKYDRIIIDEAHYLSNTQKTKKVVNGIEKKTGTLRTDGTNQLAKGAKHRLLLTGTPAKKDAHDVIPLLRLLDPTIPAKWDLIHYFMYVEIGKYGTKVDGIKNDKITEWASFQMGHCGIEKTFDKLKWLQETQHQTIYLEKGTEQKRVEKDIINLFMVKDQKGSPEIYIENVMNQLQKLRENCLDPVIIGGKSDSPKTKWVLEWIKDNPDEPVIIWAKSAKYLEVLNKELKKAKVKAHLINGAIPKPKRQVLVDDLQKGKVNVVLCGIDAMKEGFTMDRANTMIFLERDWDAVNNEQANFRFVDTKKKELHMPKLIIDVQMEDSVDQYIEECYLNKLSRTEIINNAHKYLKK